MVMGCEGKKKEMPLKVISILRSQSVKKKKKKFNDVQSVNNLQDH